MSLSDSNTAMRLPGADGVTIAADAFGDDSAPPVVLMHGGGQSRSAWRGGAQALAKAGYRAYSIDLRGHGHSDWARDGDYRFLSYAHDLAALIPAIGGRAALVGASLGGRVALLAAARFPQHVAAIALCDVAAEVDEGATQEMRAFFRSTKNGFGSLEEAAAILSALREGRQGEPAEKLRPHLREEGGRFYWRWDPRFADERYIGDPEEIALLQRSTAEVRTPMIMIRAEHSTVVRPEHLQRFHVHAPHAELAIAPGIGHMLTGDANDAYAPIIIDFLNRTYR